MRISDWSSDVCSSDLERITGRTPAVKQDAAALHDSAVIIGTLGQSPVIDRLAEEGRIDVEQVRGQWETFILQTVKRSEERRVGQECVSTCSSRWSPDH